MRALATVAVCALALTACEREKQNVRPGPVRTALFRDAAPEGTLEPGGTQRPSPVSNPYHGQAYAISEGARLYDWYNCSGCHSKGGGGIGPPLIKDQWIYGGEPGNIFDTIVKGRPNGMPTWGGRIPEYQVWQIVAFVRSLNGQEPDSATPARTDTIEKDPGTIRNKVSGVTK